jgi:hypothetical protein
MCMMTDTGARWRRTIELPDFGATERWWAVPRNNETRYMREPRIHRDELEKRLKPLYAIRVTARSI